MGHRSGHVVLKGRGGGGGGACAAQQCTIFIEMEGTHARSHDDGVEGEEGGRIPNDHDFDSLRCVELGWIGLGIFVLNEITREGKIIHTGCNVASVINSLRNAVCFG